MREIVPFPKPNLIDTLVLGRSIKLSEIKSRLNNWYAIIGYVSTVETDGRFDGTLIYVPGILPKELITGHDKK